jgi:hypothetical protein
VANKKSNTDQKTSQPKGEGRRRTTEARKEARRKKNEELHEAKQKRIREEGPSPQDEMWASAKEAYRERMAAHRQECSDSDYRRRMGRIKGPRWRPAKPERTGEAGLKGE